jgi:preprotein translocase subunit SecG
MLTLLMILAVIVAVLLIGVVLIQNPKGSGLASNFATGNQFFGVKKTTDIVEKMTWITAGIVMTISLIAAAYNPKTGQATQQGVPGKIDKRLEEIINKRGNAPLPAAPSFEDIENQNEGDAEGPAEFIIGDQ